MITRVSDFLVNKYLIKMNFKSSFWVKLNLVEFNLPKTCSALYLKPFGSLISTDEIKLLNNNFYIFVSILYLQILLIVI